MMNIEFEYMYRDAGNYKDWGSIVLSNPSGHSLREVRLLINQAMPYGEFFNALSVRLPDLHFADYNAELDLPLHEFFDVTETDKHPDDPHRRSIDELVDEIASGRLS